jgi:alpha-glucuronidase
MVQSTFQVREPASPLFGTLEKTNQVIELQITQEYMGQGRHTVFLVPMWKDVLDFDLRARPGLSTPVKALAAGKTFGRPSGGFIGVSNVGLDETLVRQPHVTGQPLWFWPSGLESGFEFKADHRRMDTPHVWG